ncbi:NUDIX domain-containing protein [Streptomyces nodosus]|uniref:NUDIX domain-containing protein n=1 Tax=Streptomyces nodosus TaxID=40318 RepID=UPI0034542208
MRGLPIGPIARYAARSGLCADLEDQARTDGIRDLVPAAVIVHADAVLFLRRSPDDYRAGTWELPGGRREKGESVLDCLTREVGEETGLTVQSGDQYLGHFDYTNARGRRPADLSPQALAAWWRRDLDPQAHRSVYDRLLEEAGLPWPDARSGAPAVSIAARVRPYKASATGKTTPRTRTARGAPRAPHAHSTSRRPGSSSSRRAAYRAARLLPRAIRPSRISSAESYGNSTSSGRTPRAGASATRTACSSSRRTHIRRVGQEAPGESAGWQGSASTSRPPRSRAGSAAG